jgi:putative ABC transport system ATP-binding protein
VNALVGPSGSGKSTLLRLLGALDVPNAGIIEQEGQILSSLGARGRRRFRRRSVWFVFQQPSDNFFPRLTLAEQLMTDDPEAGRILDQLGMAERLLHRPEALSGGEQQRAAFAQAVGAGAGLVLADEPTAELDSDSGGAVISAMASLARRGVTVIVATHDPAVIAAADHVVALDHGRISQESQLHGTPTGVSTESAAGLIWTDRGLSRASPGTASPPPPVEEVEVERTFAPASATQARDPMKIVVTADHLHKQYERGEEVVHAVEDVSLSLHSSQLVGIVGRSGSGKTTLLSLLAGWERPSQGSIAWPGLELPGEAGELQAPPWWVVAVVPQHLGLMDELTVRENIELPRRLAGARHDDHVPVDELIERLGLTDLTARFPSETSVGEQQRVAMGRALSILPRLLLADEPTGHQDETSAQAVFETLAWASENGTCCVVATHDSSIEPFLDRKLSMQDGRL